MHHVFFHWLKKMTNSVEMVEMGKYEYMEMHSDLIWMVGLGFHYVKRKVNIGQEQLQPMQRQNSDYWWKVHYPFYLKGDGLLALNV